MNVSAVLLRFWLVRGRELSITHCKEVNSGTDASRFISHAGIVVLRYCLQHCLFGETPSIVDTHCFLVLSTHDPQSTVKSYAYIQTPERRS